MFILIVFIFLVGVLCLEIYSKFDNELFYNFDTLGEIIIYVSFLLFIIGIILSIVLNSGAKRDYEVKKEHYNYIMYKVENNICTKEFEKKYLLDEINRWNESIVRGKSDQRDFWIGAFVPNIYDNLKTIEYNLVLSEKDDISDNNNTYIYTPFNSFRILN